jgi:glycerophosphoryl diester phosphodiesterase
MSERGTAGTPGPPWILGARGVPLEAPENTLAGLQRALEIGLDGVGYELRACRSGELALFADETLERTTDGAGLLSEKRWVELSSLDAGGAFSARYRGEPIPLFEEAIEICAEDSATPTLHWIEISDRTLVPAIAPLLHSVLPKIAPRIASYSRDVCLDARDAGLPSVLLAHRATERHRRFVADEHLVGFGTGPAGWRAAEPEWPCERWTIGLDAPEELLDAFRAGSFGCLTREPYRALAIRALAVLAPHDAGPYPVHAPELEMGSSDGAARGRGGWFGSFESSARVRNPFPFRVRVRAEIVLRRGAFEVEGLPLAFELAPNEERDIPFRLTGGSWRAGRDPLLSAEFSWSRSQGQRAGSLVLDAPLRRRRTTVLDSLTRRLTMLRESPHDPPASMTLRRHRGYLLVSIEDAGGLAEPHTIVHVDGRTYHGGRGLRMRLPEDFDQRADGVPFSCGMWTGGDGERALRRWSGGVPDELGSGAPGRLLSSRLA